MSRNQRETLQIDSFFSISQALVPLPLKEAEESGEQLRRRCPEAHTQLDVPRIPCADETHSSQLPF